MGDVPVDDWVSFVIFMHYIEGFAVPYAEIESLSISDIVSQYSMQLADLSFEINHNFRSWADFLQTELFFPANILVEYLENQLRN